MDYTIECSNVYFILTHLDEQDKMKIPQDVFDFFKNNYDENYNVEIDLNKPIYEQDLDDNTVDILAEIYQKYLCTTEEKINFIREKNSSYNQNNFGKSDYSYIFKNNLNDNLKNSENESLQKQIIIVENKNIIEKIIYKLKNFFKLID